MTTLSIVVAIGLSVLAGIVLGAILVYAVVRANGGVFAVPPSTLVRLHEIAEPIERRAAEITSRKDIPIGEQRAAVLALRDDANFLHGLAIALKPYSREEA